MGKSSDGDKRSGLIPRAVEPLAPVPSGKPAFRASQLTHALTRSSRGQFAIALDGTGSMQPLIDSARKAIGEILRRVSAEAGRPIKVRVHVFRDYDCVGSQAYPLHQCSDLTDNVAALESWLARIGAAGGGGNRGEAVEAALFDIFQRNEADVVLLAGDEPANTRGILDSLGKRETRTAQELAPDFKSRGTPIHAFAMGRDPVAHASLDAIAAKSGGKSGRLDGGPEMIDLAVMALLDRLKGAAAVQRYVEGRSLSNNAQDFARALLPSPDKK